MAKSQYKVGQIVSWKSKKQMKVITGKVVRIEKMGWGSELTVDCGDDGMWGVSPELNKVKIIK